MRYLIYTFALLFSLNLGAQNCEYQVILEDLIEGDGWNGGQLLIRVAGEPFTFTLGSGARQDFYLPVSDGDAIELDFRRGAFPEETSFRILNNNDSLIYAATSPEAGTNIFTTTAACVSCAAPPLGSIEVFRVRSRTVDIRFRANPASDVPEYLIQYGEGDYDPAADDDGTEVVTTNRNQRVTGLEPERTYNFYLSTFCNGRADTSDLRGPFQVVTRKAVDLGITQLRSPATGCGSSSQPVTIGITNYGGEPQSFFDIGYSLNGREASIDRPNDGRFTGIVGVDSTEFFTFDNPANLTRPGRYQFIARTMIGGDEDPSNDELILSIVRQPTITDFPYTENFEENDGFWVPARGGRGPNSWAWGAPRGGLIDQAPQGEKAWVTNLFGDYFNGEESYLVSPCFDFSEMEEDPYFSCALIVDTEADFDNLSLEMSTDDGETWATVGISAADINWYNDRPDQVWEGDGGFGNEPRIVANLLEGAAGEVVKLRFVFTSGLDDTREGVLVDAVTIGERNGKDISIVSNSGGTPCVFGADFDLSVTYQNIGTAVVDTVILSYPTAGGIFTDTILERLSPGEIRVVTFSEEDGIANDPATGTLQIRATTPGDIVPENDVASFLLPRSAEIPFFEDFENGLPFQYSIDGGFSLSDTGSPGNFALAAMIDDNGAANVAFSTALYAGPYLEGDSLKFTVDIQDSEAGDRFDLSVFFIESCSVGVGVAEFDSIQSGTYAIAIDTLVGNKSFDFTFSAETGSATIIVDDVNVARCPPSLGTVVDVIPTTSRNSMDARATLTPTEGTAPYTYAWSTGNNTRSVDGLEFGEYTATVTDRFGCTEVKNVIVRNFLDTEDPQGILQSLRAFPNPTDGTLNLRLDLATAEDVVAEVYDATGRQVAFRGFGNTNRLNESLDLSGHPAGIYLVRLRAGNAARSIRIIRR